MRSDESDELSMMSPDLNRPTLGFSASPGTGAPASRRMKIVWITISSLVAALITGLIVPGFIRAAQRSRMKTCQENLIKLDTAIQEWAIANNKGKCDPVTWDELLKDGYITEIPICPSVGNIHSYVITVVGADPECVSGVSGHQLAFLDEPVYPADLSAREIEKLVADRCAERRSQIDQAVANWARDNNERPGAPVTFTDLICAGYRWHRSQGRCPGTGEYTLIKVGERVTCSAHTETQR